MTTAAKVVSLDRRPFVRGDHVELAERLVARLRAEGEVVHDDGSTWRYNDHSHVFEMVAPAHLSRIAQSFAGCEIKGSKKPLRLSAGAVSGSIKLAEDLLCSPGFFADAPPGIVFSASFVEVRASGIVQHEHSAAHRARFAYLFGFQPNPIPTRLLDFLAQVFAPDEDVAQKIGLLQEFVGAAMLGLSTRYQRAITKVGAGANGKGVLATIIENAMPPGSCVAIAPQDFGDEYRAAMLAGKLLNIVSELPEADILDSTPVVDRRIVCLMARATRKTASATLEVSTLLERARAQLEADGVLKLSVLGPNPVRAALVSELTAQGFEVTKTVVRRSLKVQLTAALSNGAFIPLKSVASHVVGSTAAEAKQAVLALVTAGGAKLVLRGTEEVVVPSGTVVLSRDELVRFAEVAKVVAKAAKSKSGASLLRCDLAEALARVLPDAASASGKRVIGSDLTPERPNNGERRALVGRLLSAVDATRDPRTGLSFVPAIVATLRPELDARAAGAILVAAAGDGLLELRPEGGINRLSEEELSMCPPGPQGTRLSWARRTEVVGR